MEHDGGPPPGHDGGSGEINEEVEELKAALQDAYARLDFFEQERNESGVAELSSRLQIAEERMRDLEAKLDAAHNEADRYREQAENLDMQLADSDRLRREAERSRDDYYETNQKLRQQYDRLNDELQREKSRASEAATAGARAAKDRQFQNSELDKAVQESEELRGEVKHLTAELQDHVGAVELLKGQLEDAEEDVTALDEALAQANNKIRELMHEVQESQLSVQATQATLESKNAEIAALHQQLEESAKRANADLKAANERTAACERTIASLQAELKAVKEATRVKELEDDLASLKAQLAAVTTQRDEVATMLSEQQADLEKTEGEMAALKADVDARVSKAVSAERQRLASLTRDLQGEVARAEDEKAKVADLTAQKAEVEAELSEIRRQLDLVASDKGMGEMLQEQERLKEALRLRDADIARLTNQQALQLDSYDLLEEIARRLAEKAGVISLGSNPLDLDVWALFPDTAELKSAITSTVERIKSANNELTRQNDALEEQRLKLLRQLRVHAENMGGKSLKYYGLDANQLMLVNEFAENIRSGRTELPMNDRSLELLEELRGLRLKMKDMEEQLYLARASGAITGVGGKGGGAEPSQAITVIHSPPPPSASSLSAGPSASELAAQQQLRSMEEERLRRERDELAAQRMQLAAQQAASAAADSTSRALQQTIQELQFSLSRMSDENQQLRREVADASAAQERRLAALSADREADAQRQREMEAQRLATLKAAMAVGGGAGGYGGLSSGSGEGGGAVNKLFSDEAEGALAEIYRILRDKLDSSLPLEPHEMASLYRAFAALISASEAAGRRLDSAVRGEAAARSKVDALAKELLSFKQGYERLSSEHNSLIKAHASAAKAREELEEAHAQAIADAADAKSGVGGGPKTAGGKALLKRHLDGLPQGLKPSSGSGTGAEGGVAAGTAATNQQLSVLTSELEEAHSALVEALEEVAAKEKELTRYEGLVRSYHSQLSQLAAQHTTLYRSHVTEKKAWEEEKSKLVESEREANARAEGLKAVEARVLELTAVIPSSSSLSSDGSSNTLEAITNHAKVLTRQLAALEMAQPSLAKKYNAVKAELASARAAARTTELASLESEVHLRQRVLYLELWKKGAEARMERLTVMAQEWVPGDDHAAALDALALLQQRYSDLLASEASLRAAYVALRSLPSSLRAKEAEVAQLQAVIATKEEELLAAKHAAAAAQSALESAAAAATSRRGAMNGSGVSSSSLAGYSGLNDTGGNVLAKASPAELMVALTRQSNLLAEAQIALAASERKALLLSDRLNTTEAALVDATSAAHQAEDALAQARQAAASAEAEAESLKKGLEGLQRFVEQAEEQHQQEQREERQHQLLLADGNNNSSDANGQPKNEGNGGGAVTLYLDQDGNGQSMLSRALQIANRLKGQAANYRQEREALRLEVEKARSLADIASDQASQATALLKDREGEIAELQEQVRSLASGSGSDDDAIIGRLQAALLSLKSAFHSLLRRHDTLRLALQRSRVAALALEVSADGKFGELLALREDGRGRELALQRALDEARTQLKGVGRTGFTLQQATAFSNSIRRLSAALEAAHREAAAMQTKEQEAETSVLALKEEAAGFKSLIEDLVALATIGQGGSFASLPRHIATAVQRALGGGQGQGNTTDPSSSSALGRGSGSEKDTARRLVELHTALQSEKVAVLRCKREMASLRDDLRLSRRRAAEREGRVHELEQQLVGQDMEARKRESDLRKQLQLASSSSSTGGQQQDSGAVNSGAPSSSSSSPSLFEAELASGADPLALLRSVQPSDLEEAKDLLKSLTNHYSATYAQNRMLVEAGRALLQRARSRRERLLRAVSQLTAAAAAAAAASTGGNSGGGNNNNNNAAKRSIESSFLNDPSDGGMDNDDADMRTGPAGRLIAAFHPPAASSSSSSSSSSSALTVTATSAAAGADAAAAAAAAATLAEVRDHYEAEVRDHYEAEVRDHYEAEVRDHYEAEIARLKKAGMATQQSLKELIASKNAALEEAKHKLEALRAQREAEKAQEQQERERITAAAYEENRLTIERLRSALRELENAPASLGAAAVNEQLATRGDQLEGELEVRLRQLREAETALTALRDALSSSQEKLSNAVARAEAAEREVASLQRRLGDTSATSTQRESSSSQQLNDLKSQLAIKDKKLKALMASLAALKEEFVRAEEEHAVALSQMAAGGKQQAQAAAAAKRAGSKPPVTAAAPSSGASSANTSAAAANTTHDEDDGGDDSPALLKARVSTLAEVVNRMRTEVVELKQKETSFESIKAKLSRELDRVSGEYAALKATHAACGEQHHALRSEADRLRQALAKEQQELQKAIQLQRAEATEGGFGGAPVEGIAARGRRRSSSFGASASPAAGGSGASPAEGGASDGTSSSGEGGSKKKEPQQQQQQQHDDQEREALVASLKKRVRVLEAQNAALQAASAEAEAAAAVAAATAAKQARQQQQQQQQSKAQGSAATVADSGDAATAAFSSNNVRSASPPPAPLGGGGGGGGGMNATQAQQLLSLQGQVTTLSERLRLAMESENRSRKKLDALAKQLQDRGKELESSKAGEVASKNALARVKGERDALEKKSQQLQRKQAALEAATAAAYAEVEPVAALKATIAALQDSCSELRQRCEGEMPATIARLRAELEGAINRAEAAESEAADLRGRIRQVSSSSSSDDDDRFAVEAALRDKLAEAKRAVATLEAKNRSQAATLLEVQFEAEGAKQTADRLRKRIAEVTAFATIAGKGKPLDSALQNAAGAGGGGGGQQRPGTAGDGGVAAPAVPAAGAGGTAAGPVAVIPAGGGLMKAGGASSKREAELQDLVTALRRVTDKQKNEIERLKNQLTALQSAETAAAAAGSNGGHDDDNNDGSDGGGASGRSGGAGAGGGSVPAAEAAAAVKELRLARSELAKLKDRVASLDQSLKEKEAQVAAKDGELDRLRSKVAQLLASGPQQQSAAGGPAPATSNAAGRRDSASGEDKDSAAAAATLSRLRQEVSSLSSRVNALQQQNASLVSENATLKEELSAFDAAFFEELEDLKYSYAQAASKCKAFADYLRAHPPPAGVQPPDVSFPAMAPRVRG